MRLTCYKKLSACELGWLSLRVQSTRKKKLKRVKAQPTHIGLFLNKKKFKPAMFVWTFKKMNKQHFFY